jgi:regulator of RNase E activity RraA
LNAHFSPDLQVPIACGGAAVFPGDILVGDGDGVVVLPRAFAPGLAVDGAKQKRLEKFIQHKIKKGANTAGTYPPNAETLAEYAGWKGEEGAG